VPGDTPGAMSAFTTREDTRNAQYKVALVKCDVVAGTEKDTCVTSAKSAFGK
jgi:hypothetical protein